MTYGMVQVCVASRINSLGVRKSRDNRPGEAMYLIY